MTYIYMLCSLVNKPNILSIVCVLKGVYRTLQLYSNEITLQMKENCIIRTKYNWEMKTFKLIVYLLTHLIPKRVVGTLNPKYPLKLIMNDLKRRKKKH